MEENKLIQTEEQVRTIVKELVSKEIGKVWTEAYELGSKQGNVIGYMDAINDVVDIIATKSETFPEWARETIEKKKQEMLDLTNNASEEVLKRFQTDNE